jgi:phosphoserine phosphatase RsbU/P
MAFLDPQAHAVDLISGGNLSPFLFRAASRSLDILLSRSDSGLPLGVVEGFDFPMTRVTLSPGDCLLLQTDGIMDCLSPKNSLFGLEGIQKAVLADGPTTPAALGERIIKAAEMFSGNRPFQDDVTLVCFGRL